MVLSDEAIGRLRTLSNEELRAIRLHTSSAKSGTRDYELFRFVDRLLLAREGVRIPKGEAIKRFEKF